MLSPLDKIEVGHNDSGVSAGWYLDKVVVTCGEIGCEQVCRDLPFYFAHMLLLYQKKFLGKTDDI